MYNFVLGDSVRGYGGMIAELRVVERYLADVHVTLVAVGYGLCFRLSSTHGQYPLVAQLQKVGYQLGLDIVACICEVRIELGIVVTDLVADEVDFLALGINTGGQNLHGAVLDVVGMSVQLYPAVGAMFQLLELALGHHAHGYGILRDDVVGHADVDVGLRAHPFVVARGLDALVGNHVVSVDSVTAEQHAEIYRPLG